ncbi:MAG: methyltransferase domain-containing protein [Rhodomicrobium sp.]|nr:methyltransferase domain-containing protein [Rhodomicrobium sp.]
MMRLYRELARWYPLITRPEDYAEEAAHIAALIETLCEGPARTLLELGAGAGANASHLKARLRCTLTDISAEMLALSRALNPDCEHIEGDMRTLRLDRTFDVVLIHDAIDYMVTEVICVPPSRQPRSICAKAAWLSLYPTRSRTISPRRRSRAAMTPRMAAACAIWNGATIPTRPTRNASSIMR